MSAHSLSQRVSWVGTCWGQPDRGTEGSDVSRRGSGQQAVEDTLPAELACTLGFGWRVPAWVPKGTLLCLSTSLPLPFLQQFF